MNAEPHHAPTSSAPIDTILSPAQTARLTNVSVGTLAKWRMFGTGPKFVKLGARRVGYARSTVRAWLAERERVSTLDGR